MPDSVIYLTQIAPGMKVSGTCHVCPQCGETYIGRANRTYCSRACQNAAYVSRRAQSENAPPEPRTRGAGD